MATTAFPCLICCDPVVSTVADGGVIPEDLTVFTLRCLLQVEKYWLDKYQEQDKESVGIRLCDACQKGVDQAKAIYRELVEMAKKFREKQKETMDKIRASSGVHSSIASPKRRRTRRHQVGKKENLAEVVRQVILEDEHEQFQGPLLIEDWESFDIRSPDLDNIPVKQEVELPDSGDSGELEMTFPHVSEETAETEVKSEPEGSSEENEWENNADEEESTLESEESDDEEEEDWSGMKEMEADSAPSNPVTSKKIKHPPPKKKRIRCRKSFLHSLDDPENDGMFGRIRCPFCDLQGQNNTRNISLHVRNAHPSDYNKYRNTDEKRGFTCCEQRFQNWLLLWEHLSEKHESKPLYLCELCPEEFCTAFGLRCHACEVHDHKEQAIRLPHSVNIGIVCPVCGDLLKAKRDLDEHMKQHDTASEPIDESLRCPHCGILKKWNERGLHVHMANVHGVKFKRKTYQKEWPCSEPNCDKIYTGRENLEAHVAKVHKKEFLFHCDLCGAGFYKWQRLKNHQQHNHSNTQIICELCGESFTSDERLYVHRYKAHSNGQKRKGNYGRKKNENPQKKPKDIPKPPPEICDLCGKSFVTPTTLQIHKAVVHDINVKFRCHVCAKPFHANVLLKDHLYLKHKIGERPPRKTKSHLERLKFQCQLPRCKLRFTKQEKLDKHVKEAHGDSGTAMPFNCQFCGKGFSIKWKHEQHEMIHRNKETRPFKCGICGKGFANKVNVRYHELNTHKSERKRQYIKRNPVSDAQ